MTDRQRALLTPLFIPALVLGTVAVIVAVLDLAGSLSPAEVGALVPLEAAATLAETFPVPVGRSSMGSVSLSALFILAGGLLFGWAAVAVVAFCASAAVQAIEPKEVRVSATTPAPMRSPVLLAGSRWRRPAATEPLPRSSSRRPWARLSSGS